jgi:hypothetical protein
MLALQLSIGLCKKSLPKVAMALKAAPSIQAYPWHGLFWQAKSHALLHLLLLSFCNELGTFSHSLSCLSPDSMEVHFVDVDASLYYYT